MRELSAATLVFFFMSSCATTMSLRSVDGDVMPFPLEAGIVDVKNRGTDMTELFKMTKDGKLELEAFQTNGSYTSCGAKSQTFGLPTWLFWTIIAVLVLIIIVVVMLNVFKRRVKRRG